MDPLRCINGQDGFFTRAQARDAGYDDRDVQKMIRARVWHRFRRGYFAFSDCWDALDDVAQHRVRSHAVLHSLGPGVALSHISGAIEHGIAVWNLPLDRVHVTRLDNGAGRIEGDVVHHQGRSVDDDVIEINGRKVLKAERCAIEAASRATGECGLVVLDSLLFHELCDHDQLMSQFAAMQRWPFVRRVHVPIRMADARSQSPGESRGRWLFWTNHLPAPELQYKVFDRDGVLVGISDWGWPDHRLLGEFDGRVKYGPLLKAGQTASEAVFEEKRREDKLRQATRYAMFRLDWSDYGRPKATARRIESLLFRAS